MNRGAHEGLPSSESVPAIIALTPAHNEAEHLAQVVESMLAQDVQPTVWVIVNDSSTDETGAIAHRAAEQAPFIHVIDRERPAVRELSAKAGAVSAAYELAITKCPDAEFVVSVDGDVELPKQTFSFLLDRFAEDPKLGMAGGVFRHPVNGQMRIARYSDHHVPGPLQFFRREVFDALGGYQPLPYGGLDTVAEAHARLLGWKTRPFPEIEISHNRRMGTGGDRHPVHAEFRSGKADYSLGAGLVFETAKCLRRLRDDPILLAAGARLAGYLSLFLRRRPRDVPEELSTFIRAEQMKRLKPQRMERLKPQQIERLKPRRARR